jgi:(p)ppGpp synthase/HD superfamily hydrolase
LEGVRRRFGDRVAKIVDGRSDAYTIPKPPWKQRKLDYLEVLRRADDDIRLVSTADKRHNVRTIPAENRLLDELQRVVTELETLATKRGAQSASLS